MKCVDVPASSDVRTWTVDREGSQPLELRGVWGIPSGDVFAVGLGAIIRFHDGEWRHESIPTTAITTQLHAIWGTSPTDIFAVGAGGTILHYDGVRWSSQDGSVGADLKGVWGSSATDVYAVGTAGTFVHYDGTNWRAIPSGTTATLSSIWGSSATDVYVVAGATVLHYDGSSSWTSPFTATNVSLQAIWGASAGDVFAVGGSTIVHYDGASWTQQTRSGGFFFAIWGRSGADVFAVGVPGLVQHFDGTTWSTVPGEPAREIRGVWVGSGDAIVVGSQTIFTQATPSRGVVSRYNGSQWTLYRWPMLSAVWAASGTNAFAVGQNGKILHYDGTAWRAESSGTDRNLADVWGTAPNNVFAVGGGFDAVNGTVIPSGVILHYDGIAWSTLLQPPDSLTAVWGSSAADVYAVGANGLLLHYNGTWTQNTIPTSAPLRGIWGRSSSEIYVVGPEDSVFQYNGTRWTAQKVEWPGSPGVYFTWLSSAWGSAATNIFAVGTLNTCSREACFHAVVARYCGGGSWTGEGLAEVGFNAVWGSSASDIYVVGDSGVILRRDGTAWVRQPRLTTQALNDVWGTPDGVLFAVGGGAILSATR